MKIKKKLFSIICVAGILIFIALSIISHSQAYDLVHHPLEKRKPLTSTPHDYGLPFEEISIKSQDGVILNGWFVPSKNGAVVMAQHGYKSNRASLLQEAKMLHKHGYGVLLTSIRSHDLNEGELITFGHFEMQDLQAWYDYLLTRKDVDFTKIGAIGNSMGGTLLIQYAALNPNIKALVSHSAFSSLEDTVATSVNYFTGLPAFPFAPMILFWSEFSFGLKPLEVNAQTWISKISPRPVLILQGGKDIVISVNSGELLYHAARSPKEFWFESELEHANFDKAIPNVFEKRVVAFFNRNLF